MLSSSASSGEFCWHSCPQDNSRARPLPRNITRRVTTVRLLVCLDCERAEFSVPERQLQSSENTHTRGLLSSFNFGKWMEISDSNCLLFDEPHDKQATESPWKVEGRFGYQMRRMRSLVQESRADRVTARQVSATRSLTDRPGGALSQSFGGTCDTQIGLERFRLWGARDRGGTRKKGRFALKWKRTAPSGTSLGDFSVERCSPAAQ